MSSAKRDACGEQNSQRASLIVQLPATQTATCDWNASFVHMQVWFVAVHGESAMAVARHSIFAQSASKMVVLDRVGPNHTAQSGRAARSDAVDRGPSPETPCATRQAARRLHRDRILGSNDVGPGMNKNNAGPMSSDAMKKRVISRQKGQKNLEKKWHAEKPGLKQKHDSIPNLSGLPW